MSEESSQAPPEQAMEFVDVSDAALMQRVVAKDADAFSALYDRHVHAACAIAYRVVGVRAVEEVCQEAFLSIWRSAHKYDPTLGSARTWILSVVRNRAIDEVRRRARLDEREVQDEVLAKHHPCPKRHDPESSALRNAAATELQRALASLSDEHRQVIELSFYSGYCHREIAQLQALPLGTVKARMRRGLAKLRTALPADPSSGTWPPQ